MARVKNNIITQGLSGTLGRTIVFRQVKGRTIVATLPGERNGDLTEKQQAQQQRFREAATYGKAQMKDPKTKAEYQALVGDQNRSAYTAAVTDYLNAPTIHEVDTSRYTGKVGDVIRVEATDDYQVTAVTVRIAAANGTLVEEGAATRQANGMDWLYTAKKAATITGSKLTVKATDKPGNSSEVTKTL